MTVKNIYTQLLLCDFETIEKDSKNPHFKNQYASLPNILSIVVPVLKKHGIVLSSHTPESAPDTLVVTLTHADTESSVCSHIKLLAMTDMQKWGGCITYATRYGLLSLLGIAADMDDNDGNDTLPSKPKAQPSREEKYVTPPPVAAPVADTPPVVNLEQLKKDLKNLWNLKREAAIEADDSKATRTANFALNDFMKPNEKNEMVELPIEVLVSIHKWLRDL